MTTVALLAVVAADGAAWYQLEVRADRPPSFARGGSFAVASAPAEAVSAPAPAPTTATTGPTPEPVAPAPVTTAPPAAYAPDRVTAVSASPPVRAGVLPAAGTYTWRVDGSEGATGFGSRRLPERMTLVAHDGVGEDAGRVVLDTTYSPDHQERLIVADAGGALVATYEAGQVRFGPMAQANSGSYDPPMAYVPADLRPGAVTSGTSRALDADGDVQRTEAWSVTVVGRTTIPVLGTPTQVWEVVLQRDTTEGSAQEVHRTRRQWWDPNRRMVVRYRDTMHGQQRYGGVTFTYDSDLTADLLGYQP